MADRQLDSAFCGDEVRQGLDAVIAAGGAPAVALAATLAASVALGGNAADPATKEDLWAEVDGFLIVTPQAWREAEAVQTIAPVANVITVDGAAFWNARSGTITANLTFNSPINITARRRRFFVKTSGADRTVSAVGFDRAIGMPATVPNGQTGIFEFYRDGVGTVCAFAGAAA